MVTSSSIMDILGSENYLLVRSFCAFLVGIILSQAGSFVQLVTRNILASPSTLGIDGLSIIWILISHSLSLAFTFSWEGQFLMGGVLFVLMSFFYHKVIQNNHEHQRIIMVGLIFSLLVGAFFSLWNFLFLAFNLPFPTEILFGHFKFSQLRDVIILMVAETFIILGSLKLRREMIVFSFGKQISRMCGLDQKVFFLFILLSSILGTFIAVNLFGSLAFLGLIFPIIARKLWFKRWDLFGEFGVGAFFNGLLLMGIDLLCYFFPVMGAEIPVGLLSSLLGALVLMILMIRPERQLLAKREKTSYPLT